jgi:hypothetical protein
VVHVSRVFASGRFAFYAARATTLTRGDADRFDLLRFVSFDANVGAVVVRERMPNPFVFAASEYRFAQARNDFVTVLIIDATILLRMTLRIARLRHFRRRTTTGALGFAQTM